MTKARPFSFEQACNRYVHRFTMDHIPMWARKQRSDGTFYAPHFASDKEWYENTKFKGEDGWLGVSTDCYTTNLTWPLGKSLSKPYRKGF